MNLEILGKDVYGTLDIFTVILLGKNIRKYCDVKVIIPILSPQYRFPQSSYLLLLRNICMFLGRKLEIVSSHQI